MDVVIVTGGVLLHVAVGRWVSSPWLVPDLTLVALVVALARCRPSTAMRAVVIVSLLAMTFTAHHPLHAAAAYAIVGWGIKVAMSRLAMAAGLVPLMAIGVAEALLLVILGSPLAVAGVRWALTCACGFLATATLTRRLS